MTDAVYPYDTQLYDRSFLNCYQRQAMVMLAERRPDLPLLFHNCLVSSDSILEQVVRINRPKYDFQSELLSPQALALIGITRRADPVSSYAEAKPLLLQALAESGYVIVFVDVFYLPHTPEYRTDHLVHTVTLVAHDAGTGQWAILDDNRASVLCRYAYPETVIADAYDNGKLRTVSWFPTGDYDAVEAKRASAAAFAAVVDGYQDSYALFTGIRELLTDPWIAPARSLSLLYDALSVHQGSRTCLREFMLRQPRYASAEPAVLDIIRRDTDLRNQFLIGRAIGRVDLDRVTSAALELRSAEENLMKLLRDAPPAEVEG